MTEWTLTSCATVASCFLSRQDVTRRGWLSPADTAVLWSTTQVFTYPSFDFVAKKNLLYCGTLQQSRVVASSCIAFPTSGITNIGTFPFRFPGTWIKSIHFIKVISSGFRLLMICLFADMCQSGLLAYWLSSNFAGSLAPRWLKIISLDRTTFATPCSWMMISALSSKCPFCLL